MKLFSATVCILGTTLPVSSAQYYENCSTPLGENLFGNPRFQITHGTKISPWSTEGKFQIVPNEVGPGNAVQFRFRLGQDLTPELFQNVPLCGTQHFLASIDYKIEQLTPTPMKYANVTDRPVQLMIELGELEATRKFRFDDPDFGKWATMQNSLGGLGGGFGYYLPFFCIGSSAIERTMEPGDPPVFFQLTVANPSYTRLPRGPLPTAGKSKELVANGGFESGRVAPWKESINVQDDYYDTPTPGRLCVPGGRRFRIASPGLRAEDGTHRSSFKAHFCANVTNPRTGIEPFISYAMLEQKTPPTALGKPYVLSLEFDASPLFAVLVSYDDFAYISGPPIQYGNPGEYTAGNKTFVYQRIFTGLGRTSILLLKFVNTKSRDILDVFVDNISIRPLDQKAMKRMVLSGEAL